MENSAPRRSRSVFLGLVAASQVLGLAAVVMTGVWMGSFGGGFAWDSSPQQFNVHPLCMVLGLVFLQGDAVLVYRVFQNEPKKNVKVLHGIIHMLALVVSIIGVIAVFEFHNAAKLYSLHSWLGMITICIFFLQWVIGLLFFLFPGASAWLRASYLPVHVFSGLVLLALSIGTCLVGIVEKLLFSIMATYDELPPEGVLGNTLGVVMTMFGVLVAYLVTNEDYRRPPNPEEQSLSIHFKNLTEGESIPSP